MIEDLASMEPPTQPSATPDPNKRREQFKQVNASLALEGMRVDAADLAIQEQIALGALSADDAVAMYFRRARKGAP